MSLNKTLSIVQENLNVYFCPICLIFGIIGCLLNILLFFQKQFRTISCCTYFLSASFPMMFGLIVGLVPHIYSLNHPHPIHTIFIVCRIRSYFGQSLSLMYRWLMTMACIDRCILSSKNVYLRKYANPSFAYSIMIKIIVLCIILPIHNLIFLDVSTGYCMCSKVEYQYYYSIFTFTLSGLIPITIMIICFIIIRSNLVSKQKRRYKEMLIKRLNKIDERLNSRDNQVLLMLFIQILFYIISTIPWMIFLLYANFIYYFQNFSNNQIIINSFLMYLTEIIVYIYPTLSFYMNTLTSQTFRHEFILLISNLFIRKDNLFNNKQNSIKEKKRSIEY